MRTRRSRPTSSSGTTSSAGDETFFLTGVDEHGRRFAGLPRRTACHRRSTSTASRSRGANCPDASTPSRTSSSARRDHGHAGSFVTSFNASTTTAMSTKTSTPVSTASAARRSSPSRSSSTATARTTASGAGVHRGEELLLPALRVPGPAARALRRAARLRAPELPLQRGPELHRRRAAGLLDQPRGADLGHPAAVGREPGRLRLGRRARQLPERAHVRAAGRGSPCRVLAGGAAPDGEGHPPLPLRLLAGDAARRQATTCRSRSSCTATCCSTSHKISKSLGNVIDPLDLIDVYGADTRPLLGDALGLVRPGRQRVARRHPRAVRARARQRARQPALADDGDDRALPRRRASRRPGGSAAIRRRARSARSATCAAHVDAWDLTGALEPIWDGRPHAERYVEETKPWELAKDEARAAELDRCSSTSPTAFACVAVALCRVPARRRRRRSSRRSASRTTSAGRTSRPGGCRRTSRDRGRAAALPAHRARRAAGVIDTHAHLDACDDRPERSSRARARPVSSARRHGRDRRSTRAARRSRSPSARRACRVRSASIRTRPADEPARPATSSRELLAHPTGGRGRRDRARLLPRLRAARRAAAAVRARSSSSPRELGLAGGRSTPAPPTRTRSTRSPASTGTVVLHCFSSPGAARRRRSSGATTSRSPATSRTRRRSSCAPRRARVPADRILAETDSPYLAPQPLPRPAERARVRRAHGRGPRGGARRGPAELARPDRRERDARLRPCRDRTVAPKKRARPALPRRREHPRRDRAARRARSPTTSCSRSGPGLGVLTRFLADRVAHVHAVELDRALEPQLAERLTGARTRARLRRRARARPRRARSAAGEARREPALQRRHAARRREPRRPPERRALVRDGAARGRRPVLRRARRRRPTAPSRCSSSSRRERTGFHPVAARPCSGRARTSTRPSSPSARRPLPARLRARQARRRGRVRAPAQDARRTRSQLAGRRDRERAVGGARRDRPSRRTCGPRRSSPPEFVALAAGARVTRAPAPAKINLALVVGPLREDGKHEVATVLQRVDLADRVALEPAPQLARRRASRDDTLVARRAAALAEAAGVEPRWRVRDRQAHPGRRRARRRQLRRRDRAPARERDARRAAAARRTARARARRSAPTSRSSSSRGPQLGTGDGTSSRRSTCRRTTTSCSSLPDGAAKAVDGCRLRRLRRRERGRRASTSARDALLAALAARAPAARPRGAAAERPRLVAARAELRARSARSAPTSAAPARRSTASSTTATRPTRAASALWRGRGHARGSRTPRGTVDAGARGAGRSSTVRHRAGRWLRGRGALKIVALDRRRSRGSSSRRAPTSRAGRSSIVAIARPSRFYVFVGRTLRLAARAGHLLDPRRRRRCSPSSSCSWPRSSRGCADPGRGRVRRDRRSSSSSDRPQTASTTYTRPDGGA